MLTHAKLENVSKRGASAIDVQFNPTEYGIDSGVSYSELQVPGLPTALLQFVRGETPTLNLELFLDGTDARGDISGPTVHGRLEKIREFTRIDPELHAPPVCRFSWGETSFDGVVTSLREKLALFDERGRVLRARVTLTMKRYASVRSLLRQMRLHSPDRTRVRVVRQGETLAQIATEAYGDGRLWRLIADANGIERPRWLEPGLALVIPPA